MSALQTILSRSALEPGSLSHGERESEEDDVASGLEAFSFERWSKPVRHKPRCQIGGRGQSCEPQKKPASSAVGADPVSAICCYSKDEEADDGGSSSKPTHQSA